MRVTNHLIHEVHIEWDRDREGERRQPYVAAVLGWVIDTAVEHALELVAINAFGIFVSVLDGAKWFQLCAGV